MCVLSVVEIDGTPHGMVTNCVDTTFRYNRGFTILPSPGFVSPHRTTALPDLLRQADQLSVSEALTECKSPSLEPEI